MEIGGLGFVQSLASSTKEGSQSSSPGTGFHAILGATMKGSASTNGETAQEDVDVSKENLHSLLQFLKMDDILNAEDGMELFNEALSMGTPQEYLALVEHFLLNDKSLMDLMQTLKLEESSFQHGENVLEDLMKIMEQLLALPLKDLNQLLTGELKDIVKVVKAFELLSQEQPFSKENGQLRDQLQQLMKKIEQLLEQGNGRLTDSSKQMSRMDYLQRTFSQAATEINATAQSLKVEGQVEQKVDLLNNQWQSQQLTRGEPLTLTLNQVGRPTTSADLIKQFENILARSQFSNNGGTGKLLIRLNPEHLGALRIELIQRDAGMIAKIMTTTSVAKELLETHLNGLRQAFGSQNIQVDRVDITQGLSQEQNRYLGREQDGGSQQQWKEQQENVKHEDELEEKTFSNSLEEAIVNTEA